MMTKKRKMTTPKMTTEMTNKKMTTSEFRPDFSTLPDLVLFKIFEFLKGPRELKLYEFDEYQGNSLYSYRQEYFVVNGQYGSILDARLVCKKFHDMAWDRRLLTELRIHPQILIRDLIQAIEERPLIEELVINFSKLKWKVKKLVQRRRTSWENHSGAVFQSIKTLTKLKTLKIVGLNSFTSLDPVFFEAFESSKDTLTTLHLEKIQIMDGFNLENLQCFANIKALTVGHLEFFRKYEFKRGDMEKKYDFLMENLPKLEDLEIYELYRFKWSPFLRRLRKLEIGDDINEADLDAIEMCTSLELLILNGGFCTYNKEVTLKERIENLKKKVKVSWGFKDPRLFNDI